MCEAFVRCGGRPSCSNASSLQLPATAAACERRHPGEVREVWANLECPELRSNCTARKSVPPPQNGTESTVLMSAVFKESRTSGANNFPKVQIIKDNNTGKSKGYGDLAGLPYSRFIKGHA